MQQQSSICGSSAAAESDLALNVVCTPEVASVGAGERRSSFYVMASIKAPEYHPSKRAPVDMICVIDRSGSMAGERLAMAIRTVEFVVANLGADDRLGIVTYDDQVSYHFSLRQMTPHGKEAAQRAVRAIRAGGSTNLCGGLVEAVSRMSSRGSERGEKNEVASVLLFTDGQANVGYTSGPAILRATVNPDFARAANTTQLYGRPVRLGYGANFTTPPVLHHPLFQPQQLQLLQLQQLLQQQQQLQQWQQPMQQQQQQQQPMQQQQQQQQQQQPMQQQQQQQQQQSRQQSAIAVSLLPSVAQAPNPDDFLGSSGASSATNDLKKKPVETASEDLQLPCTINTFGFGADHDAALLKMIAENGQGMYYYIDSTKAISEAYADCLGGLLSVVGQDIRVAFEVPRASAEAGVRINRVFSKFKLTERKPGLAYELALGDIQSEEQRDLLIDVTLPAVAAGGQPQQEEEVVKVTVNYTNVITGQRQAQTERVAVVARPAEAAGETRHHNVDRQLNRLLAAEAMEASNDAAAAGDMQRARDVLRRAGQRITESVSHSDAFCCGLVTDLSRCEAALASRTAWMAGGQQMLANQMQAHHVQRSNNVGWAGQQAYQSQPRMQMQQAFQPHKP